MTTTLPLIIVPYRNREENLQQFLAHYAWANICIVEQADNKPFNRGKLLNIGFLENKGQPWYIFHDVDMLAESFAPYHVYPVKPTQMATAASQFDYQMPYPTYLGGVTKLSQADFEFIDGYSNEYYSYGAEDDDLYNRCKLWGLEIDYVPNNRYTSLPHGAPDRSQYQKNIQRLKRGCSTGLHDCSYWVKSIEHVNDRITHLKVSL